MNSNNFIIKLLTERLEIGIEIKDQAENIISFARLNEQVEFTHATADKFRCSISPDLDLSPDSKCMNFAIKGLDSAKYYDIMFEFQKKFGSKFEVGRNYFKVIY